jgi:hypothetical protein
MLQTGSTWVTNRKAALIVGHPGHELRVYRWLELARPTVFVLTDGSGRGHQSRLPSTSRVLADAGATPGAVYGRFTDAEMYAAILAGDAASLLRTAQDLAQALLDAEVDYVVGDALEGFNPSHDLCRFLINIAVSLVENKTGRALGNFDFLLDGSPEARAGHEHESAIRVALDARGLERKLTAADGYAELRAEAAAALEQFGPGAFLTEYLRPVSDWRQGLDHMEQEPPSYERYGEQRVRSGNYDEVIRYRSNVQPLIRTLWCEAGLA